MKKIVIFSLATLLFVGCAGSQQSLYYWDGKYQQSVYEYLNEEGDISEQISKLEDSIKQAETAMKKIPPGLYAHLGILYNANGNLEIAKKYFQKEVEFFPQSTKYIQFLLSDNKKGSKNGK